MGSYYMYSESDRINQRVKWRMRKYAAGEKATDSYVLTGEQTVARLSKKKIETGFLLEQ